MTDLLPVAALILGLAMFHREWYRPQGRRAVPLGIAWFTLLTGTTGTLIALGVLSR